LLCCPNPCWGYCCCGCCGIPNCCCGCAKPAAEASPVAGPEPAVAVRSPVAETVALLRAAPAKVWARMATRWKPGGWFMRVDITRESGDASCGKDFVVIGLRNPSLYPHGSVLYRSPANDHRPRTPHRLHARTPKSHRERPSDRPARSRGWPIRHQSGLPSVIERFTWKTFQKTFYRDPASAVCSVERASGGKTHRRTEPSEAARRPPRDRVALRGIPPDGVPMPLSFDRGLVIDYSRTESAGTIRLIKDPLVALTAGSADELLGVSYWSLAAAASRRRRTSRSSASSGSTTSLRRSKDRPQRMDALRLTAIERSWAEQLFAAIIGTNGDNGLPAFASVDLSTFWRCFDETPAPLVRAGLRPHASHAHVPPDGFRLRKTVFPALAVGA